MARLRRTLLDLRPELGSVPHNGGMYVPRAALENFFRRRWCFAATAPPNGKAMDSFQDFEKTFGKKLL